MREVSQEWPFLSDLLTSLVELTFLPGKLDDISVVAGMCVKAME